MPCARRGVYKDCTLEFYAPRPFGHTEGNGAVFLHCDITSMSRGTQYFVKSRGPVAAIDTRIHGEHVRDCNWRDFPLREERYYHAGLLFNGSPCPMGSNSPETSIDLTGNLCSMPTASSWGETRYTTYTTSCGATTIGTPATPGNRLSPWVNGCNAT